jgi:two-component system, OmpR family, phosphate regulon sensor histidine kinase PhoR
MRRKRLLWQLFPSFLVITVVSLVAASLYAVNSIHQFYLTQLEGDLQARGDLLVEGMQAKILAGQYSAVEAMCREFGAKSMTRITVILPTGKVVADSEHDPATMENHSDRPEIIEVLAGKTGESFRYSYTLQKELMYIAVPVRAGQKILAVLRLSIPVGTISEVLYSVYLKIALSGLVIAVAAGILSLWVSRRITRPLEEMKDGADRFARGDLSWRLAVPETQEMGTLAEGLNSMAEELGDRIRTLTHQRNEQEAVLSSMAEGVLAIDAEERIISLNHAGANLLEVNGPAVHGRSIQEVVRNTDLQEFVAKALTSREPVEGDIVLRDNGERYLQAHGTVLHDGQGKGIGAVIVLNDVTRLHRLETVRRDFVANVSHELKTPITSIKGFVETLLDGALKNPEDAERFLRIVARQTDRLNAIIEDILILSRVEDETEKDRIQLEKGRVRDILKSAIQLCELKAKEKETRIDLSCEEGLLARMNGPLLEQAVVNLIDNAIKYSETGKEVKVEAVQGENEVLIHVRDQGCGIEKEYLPRIFERFYRVDKARSRKLGGTGLGLAIVKHITLAQGGNVTIESSPGQGSTFTLHLPAN